MALFLGSKKQKVNVNNEKCYLNLYTTTAITNGIKIISSDNQILTDCRGLYLTVLDPAWLRSSDNFILQDTNKLYLTTKESV